MAVVRWILGRIILLVDFLYRPRGVKRDQRAQAGLDRQMAGLALYQYAACPFCVKVRWAMRRYSLNIDLRDAKRHPQFAEELVAGGGKLKVPCLRIERIEGGDGSDGDVTWMYESSDIIAYLEQRLELGPVAA